MQIVQTLRQLARDNAEQQPALGAGVLPEDGIESGTETESGRLASPFFLCPQLHGEKTVLRHQVSSRSQNVTFRALQ